MKSFFYIIVLYQSNVGIKMETQSMNIEDKQKEYLKNCFMQKCQNEIDDYYDDEESALDKYAKLSIKYLPIISIGISSSVVLLNSPIKFNIVANFIAISILFFFIATMLITRFYLKNKDNKEIKLDIYDSWTKTILLAVVINIGLYFVGLSSYVMIILGIATIAMLIIQSGRRSL